MLNSSEKVVVEIGPGKRWGVYKILKPWGQLVTLYGSSDNFIIQWVEKTATNGFTLYTHHQMETKKFEWYIKI